MNIESYKRNFTKKIDTLINHKNFEELSFVFQNFEKCKTKMTKEEYMLHLIKKICSKSNDVELLKVLVDISEKAEINKVKIYNTLINNHNNEDNVMMMFKIEDKLKTKLNTQIRITNRYNKKALDKIMVSLLFLEKNEDNNCIIKDIIAQNLFSIYKKNENDGFSVANKLLTHDLMEKDNFYIFRIAINTKENNDKIIMDMLENDWLKLEEKIIFFKSGMCFSLVFYDKEKLINHTASFFKDTDMKDWFIKEVRNKCEGSGKVDLLKRFNFNLLNDKINEISIKKTRHINKI